ncbi:MAG: hypothetical protein F4Y22_01120 [Gammaproteobacteria bacterium]|nr:hypothetical protein [Gammaproteobacteria bacterium]MYH47702.1 hypothetical protein [Gammaproteobacteria bacterium]MYL14313.1 hypothetical protein [Gammaproteobacteria bacterium]
MALRFRQFLIFPCSAAALAVLTFCGSEDESGYRLEVSHRVEFNPIGEMSGIVRNPFDGSFWVHNDSGDEPRLFALDAEGRVQIPANLGDLYHSEGAEPGKEPWPGLFIENATNQDWEDVTSDGVNLYIADMGNNRNARRNLGIYVVPWNSLSDTQVATATRFIPVRYPEQTGFPPLERHFDSESLFFADGSLYVITKHRQPVPIQQPQPGANLYRLDSQSEAESNALTLIDHHPDLTSATAAELSPDGGTLAVLSYTAIWLFERPETGDAWLSAPSHRLPLDTDIARQVEAIAWLDDETLIITNEQRDWFEAPTTLFLPSEQ